MKVFIINGPATHGKSSFIALAKEAYPYTYELSMIDKVKEIAKKIGWDGQKDEKGRRFLADLKDAIERYDKDIIYNAIARTIFSIDMPCPYFNESETVFFINARSPEDIVYLKNAYNAKTIFVVDPRKPKIVSNHADADVDNYTYDYTIVNDGTLEDLKTKAKEFMKMILDEH